MKKGESNGRREEGGREREIEERREGERVMKGVMEERRE